MEWTENYNLHIEHIDFQHKELARIISELQMSVLADDSIEEIDQSVKFLIDYTKFHFLEEEKFMKVQYPRYEEHKQYHQKLLMDISDVIKNIEDGKSINGSDFIDFITNWLMNHILSQDRKIGEFVAGN